MGGPNDGYSNVRIPDEMLLPANGNDIATIVDSIFLLFKEGGCQQQYISNRAILAPTLDVVNAINEYMTDLHVAESKTYLSCDTVCKADSGNGILADMHTPEFLNGLKASGIPNHALTLKVGSPVMLLRNIDHLMGLCNGTRLIITRLMGLCNGTRLIITRLLGLCNGTRLIITRLSDHVVEARLIITRLSDHVVEAKIVSGNNAGQIVLIPRMSITPTDTRLPFKFQRRTPTDTRLPFKFQRRQFPLMLSYAMTINKSQGQTLTHVGSINKSQGQTLTHVGLLLRKPVFVHGQLYVAASRISNPKGLRLLIANEGTKSINYTTNVVYH
ncbi:uncharacterized protein LOC116027013 [Ipomoea triloba]|uniref:uncharacterized protein LOC116027013 n=1 Tax=Ipomoea triloba TaxID=35885 RepID=UPI00125DA7DA|nr:uncharacterized protein LOC116027013 [Ipomoea triloba]